ncbi:MAG: transposase [Candidatus Bilamarchaeaceae archaeon]
MLADSGYDAAYIRKFLREHNIIDVKDRNKRTGAGFGKTKDNDYRKRSAIERLNSRAKDSFGLENFTFRGIKKALEHTYACLSAILYSAVSSFLLGFKDWRKLLL